MRLTLRNARIEGTGEPSLRDVVVADGRVCALLPPGTAPSGAETDLQGRLLLPGLVNGHDHLGFSTFPLLGRPPYASVYEWARDVDAGRGDAGARQALAVPLSDRLFLGGLRNLLCGVTAVAHHDPFHPSLARGDFPVRVLARYQFAHSPGLTRDLRRTYRSTDRRIPWMVHAAEGGDARCLAEVELLREKGLLRHNTVIVHGIAVGEEDARRIAAAGAAVVWCPEANLRLYERTADVARLRAAGVALGLGSDSPVSGVRDPLSNLAAARALGILEDAELIRLATHDTARVARLALGGFEPGATADHVVVDSLEGLLRGDRRSVALVLCGGRPAYGTPRLGEPLLPGALRLEVDGEPRLLRRDHGRRLSSLLRASPGLGRLPWLAGVRLLPGLQPAPVPC